MPNVDRRTLLALFGIASISPLLRAQTAPTRRVAVAKPGENRFPWHAKPQGNEIACKVTSADSAGACSIFELGVPSRSGPPLHVHHREDEWYYVLSGEFLFEVGGEPYHLPTGGSIWAPRDIRHRWANTTATEGKVILMCAPGGFENFFAELAKAPPMGSQNPAELHALDQLLVKYGMEMLGPPIFTVSHGPPKREEPT